MSADDLCKACGRPIPALYASTAIEGMHPGCWRKANGIRAVNPWEKR